MSGIFLKIAGMSVSASWLIAAAVVIRLVLKKAPKWISVLLWGIVAIRLICPFSIESTFSLIPSTETITAASEMAADPVLVKDDRGVNGGVNSAEWQPNTAADEDSINRYQIEVEISAYVLDGWSLCAAHLFWRKLVAFTSQG